MKQERLLIDGIPAILWGEKSDKLYIHVHGKMSRKEYAQSFALLAEERGYQTLSFDLPEHGERTAFSYRCDVWNGTKDLNMIADYAFAGWNTVALYACSLGAYFSLNAYRDRNLEKCLFQSPIVDMKWLVQSMMKWSGVSEDDLRRRGEIETPIDMLRWDYYCYILDNPTENWNKDTYILYGALDNLQPLESIQDFAERFGAKLTISPKSEHPFMAEEDAQIVNNWLINCL